MRDDARQRCTMPGCDREPVHRMTRGGAKVPVCAYHADLLRGPGVSIALLQAHRDPAPPPATRSTINVVIVDDSRIYRDAIRDQLATQPDLRVVGEAGDGESATATLRDHPADVVLMDVTMPRVGGIEATRHILARWPHVRVIGLSMLDEPWVQRKMLVAGAAAMITKAADPQVLFDAIRGAARRRAGPGPI